MRGRLGRSIRPELIGFVAAALAHGAYVATTGIRAGADTGTYSAWADALLKHGFDYGAFLAESSSVFPPTLYIGFITLVALCKLAFGAQWGVALVVLNVLAAGLVGALLVRVTLRATESRASAFAALLLFLASYDLVSWSPFLLGDSTFVLLSFAPFAVLARGMLHPRRTGPWTVSVILMLLLLDVFYRPTGVILLPAFAVGVGIWMARHRVVGWLRARSRALGAALAGAGLLGGAALGAHAWWMQDPARWPLRAGSHIMRFNAEHYRLGEVVWDRPETFHSAPVVFLDFVAISLDRLAHYFYCCLGAFSLAHNIAGAAFFLPTYALALYGTWAWLFRRERQDPLRRALVLVSALLVLSFALFHAMVQVDYDWRYRLPILPHLIFLAACGVAHAEARLRRSHSGAAEPTMRCTKEE